MTVLHETIMKNLLGKAAVESNQILLVVGDNPASPAAKIHPLIRRNDDWVMAFKPINAAAGKNGFASSGKKREGDGMTPSGLYPLEFAFGYAPQICTKMEYRQTTGDDIWVDDVNSVQYNTWVRKADLKAASYEEMRRTDKLYEYGIVIGYNRNPVVKGHGSAIFFHVWEGEGTSTAGCIAMAEEDILALLGWLDPSQKPMALIRTVETIKIMMK